MPWIGKKSLAILGFLVAILFLVFIGLLSWQDYTGFSTDAAWVNHTRDVIQEEDSVVPAFKDMQIAVRGYLITGDEKYLARYYSTLSTINPKLIRLRQLTADNPPQQKRLHDLEPLINLESASLNREIETRKTQGFNAALQLILTDHGTIQTNKIEQIMKDMKSEENKLLDLRRTKAVQSRQKIIYTFALGIVFSFVFFIVSFYVWNREVREREQAQQTLDHFFNLSDELFFIASTDGQFIQMNPAWEKTLGFTREELMAKPNNLQLIHPDDLEASKSANKEIKAGNILPSLEIRFRCKDGTYRWFLWSVVPKVDQKMTYGYARDITERKQMEETLKHSEERFRLMVEEVKDYAIIMLDPEGRVASWNEGAENIKGYKAEEIIGKYFSVFYTPEDVKTGKPERLLKEALVKGRIEVEGWRVRKNGSRFLANVVITALFDEQKTLRGFSKITQDITERKQAQDELQKAHDELEIKVRERTADLVNVNRDLKTIGACNQVLVHATNEFELLRDICRVIVEVGGYRLAWAGYMESDEKKSIRPVAQSGFENGYLDSLDISWTDTQSTKWPSATAIQTLKACTVNDILHHPGFTHWRSEATKLGYQSLISLPLIIEEKPLGALTIYAAESDHFKQQELDLLTELSHDLEFGIRALRTHDELEKTLYALKESDTRYRQVIAQADEVPYYRDYNTKALTFYANDIEKITGYSAKELTLEVWDKLIQKIIMRNHNEGLSEAEAIRRIRSGEVAEWKADYRIKTRSGETRWLADSSIQVHDAEGKLTGALGILQDITERHQKEEEVRKLNEELEQRVIERTTQLESTNKELEAFSYSVSHDLRSPLRSIDGFSLALLEDYGEKLDGTAKDYLTRVRSATQRMGELIDDLLNLSRVTRNEMNLEVVNLSNLAKVVVDKLLTIQPDRHVEISIMENLTVRADSRLMNIVLENLFGNAFKFTGKIPNPRIEFGAVEPQNGKQVFFIRDNGAGFNMAFANKLFGAFQRLHVVTEFQGTGIGLATVQRIIHRHGGNVWAEAEVNKGATFYFSI
jgi:PAS domain S-box-containing protein